MTRDPTIEAFLDATFAALSARDIGPAAAASLGRVAAALRTVGEPARRPPARLPVCDHLGPALANVGDAPDLRAVADRFAALAPSIHWTRRPPGGTNASADFADNHANGMVVGPGGVEEHAGVMIGASLMAPGVRWPDHRHAPEETYLVLSPGRFRHGESDWFEPGVGGTLFNTPDVVHAMASGAAPLFAVWLLWVDPAAA